MALYMFSHFHKTCCLTFDHYMEVMAIEKDITPNNFSE